MDPLWAIIFYAQVNYGHMVVARVVIYTSVKLKGVENPKIQEALKVIVAGNLENSKRVFTKLIEENLENSNSLSNE